MGFLCAKMKRKYCLKNHLSHKRWLKTETLFSAKKMGFTFDFFHTKSLHNCTKIGTLLENEGFPTILYFYKSLF
jgi:hypothetical protein